MMELEEIYQQHPDVVTREIANETLLVPISGRLADLERVFYLNAVGAFIWEQLNGERDLKVVLENLIDSYEVEKAEAEADVIRIFADLKNEGLIIGKNLNEQSRDKKK